MRGFAERIDVETVEQRLAESTRLLDYEQVPVAEAVGRVLAARISAPVDVPAFERAAMDGYAILGEDSFGASDYEPQTLEVVGECYPGRRFRGEVSRGRAVRIMTGAPMPQGADAVVPAELCRDHGDRVEILEAVPPRKHVGTVGEDIRAGSEALASGRRLRPQDAALLTALGITEVPCVLRPRVELLSTGNELLPPGSIPEGVRVVDSNSILLRSLIRRDGGVPLRAKLLVDRAPIIRRALEESSGDVVLISGGSSIGREDHAPSLLAEMGSLDFHGVSMRPSSPAGGGRLGERFVFLLPGNPVSCLCAYEFFAGPTIRALGGRSRAWPHRRLRARLGRKIVSEIGRTDYVRVELDNGRVVPIATSGASILSSTVRAVGALIVDRHLEGLAAGSEVEVLLYDEEPPAVAAS